MRVARTLILTLIAALLTAGVFQTAAAQAAFTLNNLDATVSGNTVTATTNVAANPQVTAARYGVCVRSASGTNLDYPFQTNVVVGTSGRPFNSTKTFANGTYSYFACIQVGTTWTNVGAAKTFTTPGTVTPPPPPPPSGSWSAYDNPDALGFTLSGETVQFGPDYHVDSPFTTINVSGTLRGYIANTETLLFQGATVPTMTNQGATNLKYDPGWNVFDECGAWLTTAIQDPVDTGLIRGWYHAERMNGQPTNCDYSRYQPLKSVAYAESRDGGVTWTKGGQVLTGTNNTWSSSGTTGSGDHSVVRFGDYYYMYYNPTSPWGISVARAPVTSGGTPGTWVKWNNGSFSTPGLGGATTILSGISGTYVRKLANGELMAVSNNLQSIPGTSGGMYVSFSKDGISWRKRTSPLFTLSGATYGYASLVATDGGDTLGDRFYLFYMKIVNGSRTLVRRTVDLTHP